ncbi:Uncharacterised protein at_DN1550 [Pycnogonum litorale]
MTISIFLLHLFSLAIVQTSSSTRFLRNSILFFVTNFLKKTYFIIKFGKFSAAVGSTFFSVSLFTLFLASIVIFLKVLVHKFRHRSSVFIAIGSVKKYNFGVSVPLK